MLVALSAVQHGSESSPRTRRRIDVLKYFEHTKDRCDIQGRVERAWYGDPHREWTGGQGIGRDVTSIVQNRLQCGTALHASDFNRIFGDPARGIKKILLVTLSAVQHGSESSAGG